MSVKTFSIRLLGFEDIPLQDRFIPEQLQSLLKIWRNGQELNSKCCKTCGKTLNFWTSSPSNPLPMMITTDGPSTSTTTTSNNNTLSTLSTPATYTIRNFTICCNQFYFKPVNSKTNHENYINHSLAVRTIGYTFTLPQLQRTLLQKNIHSDQEFLIIPDPVYWQIPSTLIFDKTCKFSLGQPMSKKTSLVLPATKSNLFYKQVQEAPLNHGSLFKRSGGKNTFFRQIAFGKRCILSARAMIVPDADLKPNEITLPVQIQTSFNVLGKWIILNRMPSLQPENFVALKVARIWDEECFGIPLEIVREMNADFDGDECNLYLIPNIQSQVECEILLNSENDIGSFTLGLKLSPSQDMLVVYHLKRHAILNQFFNRTTTTTTQNQCPPMDMDMDKRGDSNQDQVPPLSVMYQTLFDLYGSRTTFQCMDQMRRYYLDVLQNEVAFGISLAEIERLVAMAETSESFEDFENKINQQTSPGDGCLVTQVKAEAKGSLFHLYQMFGDLELEQQQSEEPHSHSQQPPHSSRASFWKGLTPTQSIQHAITAHEGLLKSSNIWQPGYGYSKSVYNLQSLQVDYLGRLVDDHVVLETDVLDALHYTDLMSCDAFEQLLRQEFPFFPSNLG